MPRQSLINTEERASLLTGKEEAVSSVPFEKESSRLFGRTKIAQTLRERESPKPPLSREAGSSYLPKERERRSLVNPEDVSPRFGRGFEPVDKPVPYLMTPEERAVTTGNADQDMSVSVIDFLLGGEMAILGFKYDNEGFKHDWDIAKQQWSEEPVWVNVLNSVSLVGSMAFPAARAVISSARFGKIATLGKRGAGITRKNEIDRFASLGLAEKGADISNKDLITLRKLERAKAGYEDLGIKLEAFNRGEGDFNMIDKIKLQFANRFANQYFKIAGSLVNGEEDVRRMFYTKLDDLFKSEDLGKLFSTVPSAAAGNKIYQHFLSKQRPGLVPKVKLDANEQAWADMFETTARAHNNEALEAGMISKLTYDRVGEFHIPALFKGTPKADVGMGRQYYVPIKRKATRKEIAEGTAKKGEEFTVFKPYEMPRLDSPTLLHRGADLPEVADRLVKGQLITDPAEITARGLMMDRLLLNNYKAVTDIATNEKFAVTTSAAIAKFGSIKAAEKAGYVSLDGLQGQIPATLKRMIGKKDASYLGMGEELPMIRRAVFDDMFGEAGMFAQSQMARDVLDVLTTIHKTSKTALSIPTHFQNFASNLAMLSQAGFNPLTPTNLKLGGQMAKAFTRIAKANKARGGVDKLEDIGLKLGKIEVNGKIFDLSDELLDPKVRDLVEMSAFESVEGFQNIERILGSLRKEQHFTRALAQGAIKAKKALQLGDKEGFKWFDKATQMYLAEDMVPKMTYYMGLRGKGFTRDAAILEVGRRLPMYNTVGSTIKQARRRWLPWATFPAEAVRITKNNLMDHPLRMMPWLQAPSIMQSMMTVSGLAPGSEDVDALKRQLPMWAQRHETVIAEGQGGAAVGAGGTGALVGGAAGAIKGGAAGAAAGAAIGGAAGAAAGYFLSDGEKSSKIRGAVLDWLPHSAFLLTSTSPEFGGDILPFKNLRGALEQLPAEPLAILKPIMDVMAGETAWGAPLVGETVGEEVGMGIAGMMGFLSPPFIQKYGLKTTTPDISFTQWATGEPIAGDFSNISRALLDTGQAADPVTGRPGSFTSDFLLKNFGMWKSWATDPANRLANEYGAEKHLQQIRSKLSKNLAFNLENGNEKQTMEILQNVMSTFSRQYSGNPRLAQAKFSEWIDTRINQIGRHPRLRGWSKDELQQRLRAVSQFSGKQRGEARDQMMQFLSKQLEIRRIDKLRKEQGKLHPAKKYKRDYKAKFQSRTGLLGHMPGTE